MDPFVRRLVQRMADPARPLSRNRHFHTFDSPEGKEAQRVFKRLTALKRDLDACEKAGGSYAMKRREGDGKIQLEIAVSRIKSRRTVVLEPAEAELLELLRR
jgi:hypothetical protein